MLRLRLRRAPGAVPAVLGRVPRRPRGARARRRRRSCSRSRSCDRAARADEWRYLRAACARRRPSSSSRSSQAGSSTARSIDEPTALELTEKCLRREKLLADRVDRGRPDRGTAGGGALADPRRGERRAASSIATSDEEARQLETRISQTGRKIELRLDVRGRVLYVWERVARRRRPSARRCTTAGTSDDRRRDAAATLDVG